MQCIHFNADGVCKGKYNGFACIGPKCKAEKDPPCEYNDQDFYCRKFKRFGCVGRSNCTSLEEYLKSVNRKATKGKRRNLRNKAPSLVEVSSRPKLPARSARSDSAGHN